ncbi:hypothetical protein [Paenibacillus gansuensis]|uniref:J domain-containing protein n=1 Tax=Paenibacillus gansuensis TaxID=306542 RepID=A0ABW5PIM1_9BACL
MKSPSDYLHNALSMKRSSFPQEEKKRHYRELLVRMKNEYGLLLNADHPDKHTEAMEVYRQIMVLNQG